MGGKGSFFLSKKAAASFEAAAFLYRRASRLMQKDHSVPILLFPHSPDSSPTLRASASSMSSLPPYSSPFRRRRRLILDKGPILLPAGTVRHHAAQRCFLLCMPDAPGIGFVAGKAVCGQCPEFEKIEFLALLLPKDRRKLSCEGRMARLAPLFLTDSQNTGFLSNESKKGS